MKTRTTALVLAGALFAGCSSPTNRLVPALPGITPAFDAAPVPAVSPDRSMLPTLVRVRIPHRARRDRDVHPAAISPLTQSLSIAVNSSKAVVFNTTPASPGCTTGSSGLTCTFAVGAPVGTDAFTVTTYSAAHGGGTALDRGVVTVPIKRGKANKVAITLGPVVTTTADGGMGSLRYAVATANGGDTIMFLLHSGATIALATPINITGNVIIAGPGSSKVSVSGGGTHQIFLIAGTATISGLTLTHGKASASNPGGAIYNVGSLTLAKDVIGNSTSTVAIRRAHPSQSALRLVAHGLHPHCTATTAEGGAIYNNGTLVISDTIFNGNVIQSSAGCVTAEGGAIYNDQLGSLSSTGDTYSNNSALAGGAVYNAALGLASFTKDAFTANSGCNASSGCPTSGCSATSCTSHAMGEGAAIFDHGLGITVINSTFSNNVAGGATPGSIGVGGAITLDNNSTLPSITGSTFSGNLAGGGTSSCSSGEGGAILATNPIQLDNDTFKNNSATGDQTGAGGAIVAQMDITGTGDTFTGNTAAGSGGACTATADSLGGAVYSGGNVTFNASTFGNNSASANYEGAGGAIAGTANVTINNGTFASNRAVSTGAGGATSNEAAGGAIIGSSITKITGSTFESNAVSLAGTSPQTAVGGAVVGSTALIATSNTYTSNSVTQSSGTSGTAAGGAVALVSGTWVSNGEKFASNSVTGPATAGGGGAIVGTGGCIVSNATVNSNKVRGGAAGGVGGGLAAGGACHFTHVTISGNSATSTSSTGLGGGGGLLDTGGSIILNSTITGNSTATEGGGILAETNSETITNSSISGNTVTKASGANSGGGGIAEGNGVELEQVTVANNTVTISGAGPAGGGGIFDAGGVVALYSTISGNKVLGSAPNSGGGGIYTSAGMLGLNATIGDNASSVDGGGLELAGTATASFGNATIYKNAATHNGGNVNIGSSATLTLLNSILAGGTAATGPDADNAGTFTSNGNNIVGSPVSGYTAATGDLPDTNPKLLGLANNGGPTFTFADRAPGISPGTQHIPYSASTCGTVAIASDQRGIARGAGGKCDVGAYEYAGVATALRHRSPPLRKPHFGRTGTRTIPFPHLILLKIRLPE